MPWGVLPRLALSCPALPWLAFALPCMALPRALPLPCLTQYGVEDRTLTAGTSKVGDSPLQPRSPIEMAKKERLLEEASQQRVSNLTCLARG